VLFVRGAQGSEQRRPLHAVRPRRVLRRGQPAVRGVPLVVRGVRRAGPAGVHGVRAAAAAAQAPEPVHALLRTNAAGDHLLPQRGGPAARRLL